MLILCVVACVLAVLSVFCNVFLLWQVHKHYEVWDMVTDRIIFQSRDVLNNHNMRIGELELMAGKLYGPFGFKKSEKA